MLFRPQACMYLIKLTASQQMSPFSPFYPLLRSRTSLESILVCGANTALQSAARGQTHLWWLWRSKWPLPSAAGVGMLCRPLVLRFLFSHLPLRSAPDNTGSHLTTSAELPLQEASASHLTVSTAQHHHLCSSFGSVLGWQGAPQSGALRAGLHSTMCVFPGHKTCPLLAAEPPVGPVLAPLTALVCSEVPTSECLVSGRKEHGGDGQHL